MISEQNTPATRKGSPAPGKGSAGGDPPPSKLSGHALAREYEHAKRVVDRDAEILDQLRSRASILLAALAIGGTVLGGILSNSTHRPPPWWVVVWLGLAIILCIGVLWSTRDYGRLTTAGSGRQRTTSVAAGKQQRTNSVGNDRDAAIVEAQVCADRAERAIGQARAAAKALIRAKPQKILRHASDAATELELVRKAVQYRGQVDAAGLDAAALVADRVGQAKLEIGKVRAAAEALIRANPRKIRRHALAAAAELEGVHGWRRFTQRARRGWQRFIDPWEEWYRALVEGNQRLWKIGLNREDFFRAQRHAERKPPQEQQDAIDQVLVGILYTAHRRNDGTINRRADLLRFAAALTFAFVLALGIWLSTTTSSTSTSNGTTTTTLLASSPAMSPPPTEPRRG